MFGFGTEYEGLAFWLPLIWAGLIAVAVAMYVIADGFDLGVGILFKAAGSENWRDRMMFSVAPIWDGNETWLILGGGGLFAVFHVAYAVLMPALYVPIILMLIALIFRGVAFEFRFKAERSKFLWDNAFFFGSLLATFFQGMVLGAFVQGFANDGRQFTGGTFDFLTPFSVLTGISLIFGYGLLGATWCVMKTTGELEIWARRMAVRFLLATILAMAVVSVWVPFLGPADRDALVLLAQHRLPGADSPGHGLCGLPALPRSGGGAALPPVLPGDRRVPARLSRASASASFPTSCRRTSRSGTRPTRSIRSSSPWWASPSCCRSPSPTRPMPITSSAARWRRRSRAAATDIIDAGRNASSPERRSKRLLWFVFLYVASLAIFAGLVYGLRASFRARALSVESALAVGADKALIGEHDPAGAAALDAFDCGRRREGCRPA